MDCFDSCSSIISRKLALTPLIGFSFLGSEEEKVMYLTYTPKTGELQKDTLENVKAVEEKMLKHDDIDIVQVSVTEPGDASAMMMGGGSGGALMYLIFDPDMKDFPKEKEKNRKVRDDS